MGNLIDQTHRARINKELKELGEKSCSRCNRTKPLDQFYNRSGAKKSILRTCCEPCTKEMLEADIAEYAIFKTYEYLSVDNKPKTLSYARKKELGL